MNDCCIYSLLLSQHSGSQTLVINLAQVSVFVLHLHKWHQMRAAVLVRVGLCAAGVPYFFTVLVFGAPAFVLYYLPSAMFGFLFAYSVKSIHDGRRMPFTVRKVEEDWDQRWGVGDYFKAAITRPGWAALLLLYQVACLACYFLVIALISGSHDHAWLTKEDDDIGFGLGLQPNWIWAFMFWVAIIFEYVLPLVWIFRRLIYLGALKFKKNEGNEGCCPWASYSIIIGREEQEKMDGSGPSSIVAFVLSASFLLLYQLAVPISILWKDSKFKYGQIPLEAFKVRKFMTFSEFTFHDFLNETNSMEDLMVRRVWLAGSQLNSFFT